MSHIHNMIILFVGLLGLTAFCSYIGDDDIIYQFLYRKPTPREGLVRVRWVFLKALTSIYGGGVLAVGVAKLLAVCCSVSFSKSLIVPAILACVGLVFLAIGILQNGVRRLRGRPIRPVIDPVIWRRRSGPLGNGR